MLSDITIRSVLDAGPDPLVVIDAEGQIVFANRAASRTFGYERDEFPGQHLRLLLPNHVHEDVEEHLEGFLRDGRAVPQGLAAQFTGRRNGGAEFRAEVTLSPLQGSEGEDLLVAAIRDISDRVALQEAHDEIRALTRSIFERAGLGIALVDMDGYLVQANEALETMLGYEPGELQGRHFADVTHPDDVEADMEQYRRAVAGEIDSYQIEKRYLHKDGDTLEAILRVSIIHDTDGDPRYAVGMVEDMTEHKSLQRQLLQSQRLEAVGRLAGGIAHDFNNYLTAISGYSQLVLQQLPDDTALREDLGEVLKAADSCSALTRQILAFSRRQVLEKRRLDLGELLGSTRRMLGHLLGEHIEIELDLADEPARVFADPAQLEQVLVNLAVNARDAMPGGGTLTLATDRATVTPEEAGQRPGTKPGEYLLLTVSDTGSGMSPEVQERAFEPFFTTKETGRGTGLGLSTVYGIIKQHGGNIWIDSETGAGTTVRIYLPVHDGGSPTRGEPASASGDAMPGGSGTILVVEDSDRVRRFVVRSLESLGYGVLAANGPDEALELAAEHEIDLMLTDVVMPKMSGLELADRVEKLRPDVPVLFMSGHSAEALARYDDQDRELRWIHKPFTVGALAQRIAETLEQEGGAE